jgi:methyl-accepting chemotaxis protein
MKLSAKLMVAPAVSGLMLMGVLGASLAVLHTYKSKSAMAHAIVLQSHAKASGVQSELSDVRAQVFRTVAIVGSLDEMIVTSTRKQLGRRLEVIGEAVAKAAEESVDPVVKEQLTSFAGEMAKYRKASDAAIDMSTVDPNTGIAALETAEEHFRTLSRTLETVLARVEERTVEVNQQLERAALIAAAGLLALGLLAIAGTLGFAWVTQRRITKNIHAAVDATGQVADGRLDITPDSRDTDEVGDLIRALGRMVTQLRTSLQTVQQASDSIGTASAEIATGNQDLSARTEQTASNLQQTASSMEQLTGTVRQSADSASQANQLAASAAEVAARGGAKVSEVVTTMDEINASSKKISDIIGVIDGIAFQTNILALNAAVEAARAGEQGRGFAVVASEVRSLAQRSANAAKEIKGLINASVEKVESGSRLVADAGQTMNEIVGSVQRVSDIIGEITATSAEQSDGIGQVSSSVTQLDQMTQQNAALVEESAAAAESLKDQVVRLRQIVNKFQLGA